MTGVRATLLAIVLLSVVAFFACGGKLAAPPHAARTMRGGGVLAMPSPPYAPGAPGVVTRNLVFDGDSQMGNYNYPYPDGGSTNQLAIWAETTALLLGSSVQFRNVATGGVTCAVLASRASSVVDPLLVAGETNISILQCGVNDVARQDAGAYGVTDIVNRIRSYALARRAAGWQKLVLIGPEANQYLDPSSSRYTGVPIATLDAAEAALYPVYFDLYIRLYGDPLLGIVDGGPNGGTGVCAFPPSDDTPSSYNSECLYIDGIIHHTPNLDVYGAQFTALKLVAMPGF